MVAATGESLRLCTRSDRVLTLARDIPLPETRGRREYRHPRQAGVLGRTPGFSTPGVPPSPGRRSLNRPPLPLMLRHDSPRPPRLRLPRAAPLFTVSTRPRHRHSSGIVGSFPPLNARPQRLLDEWLHRSTGTRAWTATIDARRAYSSTYRPLSNYAQQTGDCANGGPDVITPRASSRVTSGSGWGGSRSMTSSTTLRPKASRRRDG